MAAFATRYRVRKADQILLIVVSSIANTVFGWVRGVTDSGAPFEIFVPDFTTVATRTVELQKGASRVPDDGYITDAVLQTRTSDIKRGQTYVQLVFATGEEGATVKGMLIQGYLYAMHAPQLGENVEPGPGGGEGFVQSIALGDPAAGAEYVDQTVPTNAVWKVRGFAGTLVTAVAAANRFFRIDITDGTTVVGALTGPANAHAASQTVAYRGGRAFQTPSAVAGAILPVSMDEERWLPEAFVLDFVTGNIQAADDWGAGQLLIEEWLVL